MSETKKRKIPSPEFKAKVGLAPLREQAQTLFQGKRGPSRWPKIGSLN